MTARPTLRDRRRQQTAEEIERAAVALFEREGYAATTTERIAAAAGIAPRTFFRYFPTKEAVLFRDHAEKVEQFRHALAVVPAGVPPVERIRRAMWSTQRPRQDSEVAQVRARLMAEVPELRAYHAALVEAYEAVAAEALLPAEPDAPAIVAAHVVAGAIFGALRALDQMQVREGHGEVDLFQRAFAILGRMDADPDAPRKENAR